MLHADFSGKCLFVYHNRRINPFYIFCTLQSTINEICSFLSVSIYIPHSTMTSLPIVIIDNGSHTIKGGLAGNFEPQFTFPAQVSRFNLDRTHTHLYAGHDAICRSPKGSTISHCLEDENNIDWNGLEKLYKYLLYDKLNLEQESNLKSRGYLKQNKFLLTHRPNTDNKTRAKMTEMLFESFNCDGVYFGVTSTLALYAHGLTTGVVVDSGYKHTFVCPIFEGYMFPLFAKRLNYGGFTLDKFLFNLLKAKHPNKGITLSDASNIKMQTAYAAMDFFDEETAATQRSAYRSRSRVRTVSNRSESGPMSYRLPDGYKVTVNAERFQCVELMYQPNLNPDTKDEESLPYSIHQSITKSDHSIHKILFSSIVLGGGNTMIPGMRKRILKDVTHLAPASVKVECHASPQRKYATWTGGSLLGSQSQMDDIWITPELYKEVGSDSLTIRCF